MRTALRLLPLAFGLAACGGGQEPPADWLTYPGLEGHARYLPLLGSSHDPSKHAITCESCHPGDTFREPVCTGCHAQPETTALHTSGSTGKVLSSYTWTPPPGAGVPWRRPSCLTCHPKGGAPDVVHDLFFPIGEGTPHGRACSSCHADPLDKTNLAQLRCVACHGSDAVRVPLPGSHAKVLRAESYPSSPTAADCLRCHAGARVLRVADHERKAGPTGFGGAGPWDGEHGAQGARVNCFACHDARPPLLGGSGPGIASRPWAQDWKIPAATASQTAATACRGCHGPTG